MPGMRRVTAPSVECRSGWPSVNPIRACPTLGGLVFALAACGGDGGGITPSPIGTLAYVETECRDTKEGFVEHQALRIRQGDREPVTVFETPAVGPIAGIAACTRDGSHTWSRGTMPNIVANDVSGGRGSRRSAAPSPHQRLAGRLALPRQHDAIVTSRQTIVTRLFRDHWHSGELTRARALFPASGLDYS